MSDQNLEIWSYQPPESIKSLVLKHLAERLICVLAKYDDPIDVVKNNEEIKEVRVYFEQLPSSVRDDILQKALSLLPSELRSRIFLYLTCVLWTSDMNHLSYTFRIDSCLHDFLRELLKFLIDETKNLKILVFPTITAFPPIHDQQIESLFHDLFMGNSSLCHLKLTHVCTDEIIRIIGETCHQLQLLNISSSRVTDTGICYLTQVWKFSKETELLGLEATTNFISFLLSETQIGIKPFNSSKYNDQNPNVFPSHMTELCHTLKVLDLTATDVTYKGIALAIVCLEKLEDLVDYLDGYFSYLCEQFEQQGDKLGFPSLNLRSVKVRKLSEKMLHMLKSTCRIVQKCKVWDLQSNEFGLKYLEECISCFGTNLTFLEISFGIQSHSLDLADCLKYCPNLEELIILGVLERVYWGGGETLQQWPRMRKAGLFAEIDATAACVLLHSAPSLEIAVFYNIVGEDDDFLLLLCQKSLSKQLTTFYVHDGSVLTKPEHVSTFWRKNQQIKIIGHVMFPVEVLGLGNNINLKLE